MPETHPAAGTNTSFQLRHRNPLARDYVIVSRVVLVGYAHVSDGAKLTYWVIYSYDWYDPAVGGRKGYVFPTVGRLATLRHATERTIQHHLAELIAARLLTRQLQPGKPSILYIEEPAAEEIDSYLETRSPRRGENSFGGGVKKIAPHKEDKEKHDKTVNGRQEEFMERQHRGSSALRPIGEIARTRTNRAVAPTDRVSWLAQEIAAQTGDQTSSGCYKVIARQCPEELVFEALSRLKEARTDGTVLRSRGAFFVAQVRRLCTQRGLPDPLPRKALQDAGQLADERRTR